MSIVRKLLSWLLLLAGFASVFLGIRLGITMMQGEKQQEVLANELADVMYDAFPDPHRALRYSL